MFIQFVDNCRNTLIGVNDIIRDAFSKIECKYLRLEADTTKISCNSVGVVGWKLAVKCFQKVYGKSKAFLIFTALRPRRRANVPRELWTRLKIQVSWNQNYHYRVFKERNREKRTVFLVGKSGHARRCFISVLDDS